MVNVGRDHDAGDDDDDDDISWSTDEELDNLENPPSSSPLHSLSRISDEVFAKFVEMGFSSEMIAKAIEETGGNSEPLTILETLFKYSASSEASSSKSKVIDGLIAMGFSEELVLKAINDYGDDNIDELTNVLLSYAEVDKLREAEAEDMNIDDDVDDENSYSWTSDEENEPDSSQEESILQALIRMEYSREEAAIAIERCGENATVEDVVDLISAAQMARDFSEELVEKKPLVSNKKKRAYNEPPREVRQPNTAKANDELIRLPNPMIGFGVPNLPGQVLTHRPVPIPDVACGPPYFYYENVAMAPKDVWSQISRHLYGIMPEFVDSKYFCAAARKRGYVHNLPIHNRFPIQPIPPYTIQEAIPATKTWWPAWDTRTKLNCLVTCIGSAQLTDRIRDSLKNHDVVPPIPVQTYVMQECRKWNLVWVGRTKLAVLDPDEMEMILGFPLNHTRGGGVCGTERYKSLGNSFQVDTVAYHLSVLKPLFPNGIKVLSLFTGIGGGEVALDRLGIHMNVVVSVEISEVNRKILRSYWEQTEQTGILKEFRDVTKLDNRTIELLMEEYGGFDLVIGGSPCNNLAGGNRVSRVGLHGEHSSLFFEFCRILETVRRKARQMKSR